MEENTSVSHEVNNSIAHLIKKRKVRAELPEMPFPKHACRGQGHEYDSSSDSSTNPKKVANYIISRNVSDLQSAQDSNSFNGNDLSYTKTFTYDGPSNSSCSWGDTSSKAILYSLESRSVTKSSSSKTETLSISEEFDFPYSYEEQFLECSDHADSGLSEYSTDKDLDSLLYSNGVTPSDYTLSAGTLSIDSDAQQGAQKLTIDKEFEQYFSGLML